MEICHTYNSNNNMEEVERITDEMEKPNEEYSDTNLQEVNIKEPPEEVHNKSSQKKDEVRIKMTNFEKQEIEERKSLERNYLHKQWILEKKLEALQFSYQRNINTKVEEDQHYNRSTKDNNMKGRLSQSKQEVYENDRSE